MVSLLASRLGPIADQITESLSATRGSEFGLSGSAIGGSGGSGPQVGASAKTSSGEVRGTTVIKKASAQSNFRELYSYERRRIVDLRASGAEKLLEDELRTRFTRGQLVELDVELEADPSFASNLVLSEVAGMVGNDAREFGLNPSDVTKLVAMNRILAQLQVGLVPIRSRVLGYYAPENTSRADVSGGLPIYLVGVTNVDNYWQDIRTSLFSKRRYSVLARLNADGLEADWRPLKLLELLESRAPELAEAMSEISTATFGDEKRDTQSGEIGSALTMYVEGALSRNGITSPAEAYVPSDEDLEADSVDLQRKAFRRADEYLHSVGVTEDREAAAVARQAALSEAGLMDGWGPSVGNRVSSQTATGQGDSNSNVLAPVFLDAELIAIYW